MSQVDHTNKLDVNISHLGFKWWLVATKSDGSRYVVAHGDDRDYVQGWLDCYKLHDLTAEGHEYSIVDGEDTWNEAVQAAKQRRGLLNAHDHV